MSRGYTAVAPIAPAMPAVARKKKKKKKNESVKELMRKNLHGQEGR
jgi:hypothetical protein